MPGRGASAEIGGAATCLGRGRLGGDRRSKAALARSWSRAPELCEFRIGRGGHPTARRSSPSTKLSAKPSCAARKKAPSHNRLSDSPAPDREELRSGGGTNANSLRPTPEGAQSPEALEIVISKDN